MSGPRIGELFAGYGGLGMGVQAALGGEMAWYSEIDKGALKILTHRFPGVPNVGDITTVDWSTVEPVDILTGGSPCQDLSHAGKRAGMTDGTRSNLWVAMREAIAQLRPGLVVWENVRGAASASATSDLEPCAGCVGDGPGVHLRALGRVVGDLADLGYVGGWHGLRAADIGAPHGRFRFFLIAYPKGDAGRFQYGNGGAVANALSGGRNGRAPVAGRGEVGGTAAQGSSEGALLPTPAAYDGDRGGAQDPDKRRAGGHSVSLQDAVHVLPTPLLGTPRASEWKGCGPVGSKSHAHRLERDYLDAQVLSLLPTPTSQSAKHDADDRGPGSLDDHNLWSVAARIGNGALLPTPRALDATGVRGVTEGRTAAANYRAGETLSDISHDQRWGQYAAAIHRWEQITRPAPPPTETGPKGNPRLSAAFSEWLMGLPAGWVTDVPGITRNEALRALGNGVVPQQAEAAVRFLLAHLTNEVAA